MKVLATHVCPDGSGHKMTVQRRRTRLCNCIGDILVEQGWKDIGWNRFKKDQTPSQTSQSNLL